MQDLSVASTPTRLMTFEEFEQLPDSKFGRYELRRGELVEVPPPRLKHSMIQERLRALLSRASGGAGSVNVELGFRAIPEGEYRIADVAYSSSGRWSLQDPEAHFRGAPELVVEVLSPSNTVTEMRDRKKVCFETGCREFWVVDMDAHEVDVAAADGRSVTYKSGQEIPLFFGGRVPVDAIFE
jgi:Uma2 family endonuclease